MKLLKIVFVFIYFVIKTEGLKCYSCSDHFSPKCTEPTTVNCANTMSSNQFCATAYYNRDGPAHKDCSGECIEKSCLPLQLEEKCKTSEIFEFYKTTGHCCQGDLCNGAVKLSDQNVLLFVLLINLFILVVKY